MRFHVASIYRSSGFRSSVFSFENICSIGLRPGCKAAGTGDVPRLSGGVALAAAQIVEDDDIAGCQRGQQCLFDIVLERLPLIG
jgi:hypothetical protein